MHQALYRKWRPQRFEDVCGQEHVTSILQYQTKTGGLSHAYLFCGSRGTGKTTCAKILAKAVNCENPQNGSPCLACDACRSIEAGSATDVLEMDAASNNGVDNIRDIRDEVVYPPNALKKRVYIIDEVHMLSASAFNALLKTLEEPPEYVVFILATTELQKLPATIISRCQRYDFRRIATPVLANRLSYIAGQEGISLDPEAALLLGRMAQGGMRDAISLLELCAGTGSHISTQTVNETAGSTGRDSMMETVRAIAARDYDKLYAMIDAVVQSSKDIAIFWQDLIGLYREMLVLRTAKDAAAYLDLTDSELAAMQEVAKPFKSSTLLYHCTLLEQALLSMQRANAIKRIVAESTLVRMCDPELQTSPEALLARIAALEDKIAFGQISVAPATSTPAVTGVLDGPHSIKTGVPDSPRSVGTGVPDGPHSIKTGVPDGSRSVGTGVPDGPHSVETGVPNAPRFAESDPAPAREPAAPRIPKLKKAEAGGEVRTLRPLRVWAQVLDKMTKANPLSAGFYYAAKAYTDQDANVVLKFGSDFDIQMAKSYNAVPTLCSILTSLLNTNVTADKVLFECEGQSGAQSSVIDEILESAQDD